MDNIRDLISDTLRHSTLSTQEIAEIFEVSEDIVLEILFAI